MCPWPPGGVTHRQILAGGVTRKVHVLVVSLPHSDAIFVKAYLAETFCDDHVAAFAFFGGVPLWISYGNTRLGVAKRYL